MTDSKPILMIGGSYAAVNTAHYLLQFILPSLSTPHHILLLAPSSNLYHRIAAPRALVSDTLLPKEKYLYNIPSSFAHYPEGRFTFVLGRATSINPTARTVTSLQNEKEVPIPYHALILATGARSLDPVLSQQAGPESELETALATMQEKLRTAKSVIVGGGGPAGVEAASEIGEFLNGKAGWFGKLERKVEVRLVTGGDRLLPVLREGLGRQAEKMLGDVGVEVRYNTRIVGTEEAPGGKTKVRLDSGEVLEGDVYVNAVGTEPMTEYVPREWLDEKKRVVVEEGLRVEGAGVEGRVYAVGDVHSRTRGGMLDLYDSVPVLGTNMKTDLLVAEGGEKTHGDRVFVGKTDESQVVTIGQSRGVGAFGGMKVPSLAIWALKGRDYMSGMTKDAVEGRKWKKEVAWKATPLKAA
ncbi:dihydrolipoyl dehydrogenase [Sphaceloma murrayae]|uniref:Dihydrolipoyl dehydrogenase n=1 Tax=Sphaceloma murrayae TaxID=2082308 RepID=A0A2K1QI85_9PEZI|nr:dihydrolipoyl dehydrogenase [Sphaceloma murrayae]